MGVVHQLELYVSELTFENLDPSQPHLIPREDVIDSLLDILIRNPEIDEFEFIFDGDEWAKTIHRQAKKIADKSNRIITRRLNIAWALILTIVVSVLLAR